MMIKKLILGSLLANSLLMGSDCIANKQEVKTKYINTDITHTVRDSSRGLDYDKDSIGDNYDKCLNSKLNEIVNAQGCKTRKNHIIYFKTDDYKVSVRDKKKLKKIASLLRVMPHYNISLIGRADKRGNKKYNYALSQDRVDQVSIILRSDYMVDRKRIKKVYNGEIKPLKRAKNKKYSQRINRSVIIKIKKANEIINCRN